MLIFLLLLPSFELWIPSVSNEQLATFMHKKEDSMNSKYATRMLLLLHKKYNNFMNWAHDDLALNHCPSFFSVLYLCSGDVQSQHIINSAELLIKKPTVQK